MDTWAVVLHAGLIANIAASCILFASLTGKHSRPKATRAALAQLAVGFSLCLLALHVTG